jgi:alpha-galactosidase
MNHSLAVAMFTAAGSVAAADLQTTRLDDLSLAGINQGWGSPTAGVALAGPPLRVAGRVFESGIATHAPAVWKLPLEGKATEFRAWVGVQEYPDNPGVGSVEFIVRGDGRELWRSGVLRGKDPAREVRVNLAGVKDLTLKVTDGGDGNSSDHADWLEAAITHDGAPLPLRPGDPPVPDEPGDPANAAARVEWREPAGTLRLHYDGKLLFDGRVTGKATLADTTARRGQALTQTLTLTGNGLRLEGVVNAGAEAIAAETRGAAQEKFPLIRTTSGGPSRNLRNDAIYDRGRDWMLAGAAQITPRSAARFGFTTTGDRITLTFKPRFYQRHKHLAYFRPWTYQVRRDSITGWSSWWAFMRNCSQRDCDELLAVWQEQRFADYGYRFIQLDDCFQNEFGRGQARKVWPPAAAGNNGYVARGPDTWLDWRKDHYPAGIEGYVAACTRAGFEPAVWIGTYFTDDELITRHPDWFIRGPDGRPFVAPWSSCGVDATNRPALDTLVRPTFRGLREAGFRYVKIDQLRHYLYDNLHRNPDYCRQRGVTPAELFRGYLGAARQELGPDVFILSCWGVLPEAVGIADACRIGGDGYGPVTMQQYNSWNGIVWRNDPDHCDVYPQFKPAEAGNVTRTAAVTAAPADTIIRPALASIAGCMLMLSDKPAVYRDAANLTGLRRAAPVLFSVPGQLYDFDESKTRRLATMPRSTITSGANPTPIDADQFGPVCPWWLNEFDRAFDHWQVLHRLNWRDQPAAKATVAFADLGLDATKTYLVYEFWSRHFLGAFRDHVELPELKAMGLGSFAIREQLDHPQLLSTNRHLSHGAADLVGVEWQAPVLSGRSRVVAGDKYELVVRVPAQFRLTAAEVSGHPAATTGEGGVLRLMWTPRATAEVAWKLVFDASPP